MAALGPWLGGAVEHDAAIAYAARLEVEARGHESDEGFRIRGDIAADAHPAERWIF